jgi:cellulose synthase/poly-beta-1,6-N-acetylglucosamine synthase-like glycosyltransferase/peptidoglycan/xylan/chitin deacetylase (PgdA/CDA1 family)/spore germination protein YaaH
VSFRPVFHDPSGRRSTLVRRTLYIVGALVAVLGGGFAVAVLRPARIDPLPMTKVVSMSDTAGSWGKGGAQACGTRGRPACPPMAMPRHKGTPVADPIVAAFVVQWDAGSRAALKRVGDRLDWAVFESVFLGRAKEPGQLTVEVDPDLIAAARDRGAAPHLMITNYGAAGFDSLLAANVIATPAARTSTVAQLMEAVRANEFAGVFVDFENLPSSLHAPMLDFLHELRTALQADSAILSVAIPISEGDGYPTKAYAANADYVMAMLYDEHGGLNEAGAVASASWFAERLDAVLDSVPPQQVILGIGQYGYHWRSDKPEAVNLSVSEAMALSRAAPGGPHLDPRTRNPMAAWRETSGLAHRVWYLDAVSAWNQIRAGLSTGAAGAAIWRLGSDDATLWNVLGRDGFHAPVDSLRWLPNNGASVIIGDGEVLAVEGYEGRGERAVALDKQGYIQSEQLVRPPGGYFISRGGFHKNKVAITFDDGPDEDWTPAILDTLASRQAIASFFLIGRQVQRLPILTRRIAQEGHEIGNHSWSHPDFAGLSPQAIRMELSAAGRTIEAITGERPIVFRPPYIGDAQPSTEERLRPMAVANEMGYRIAGLEIDPKDWYEKDPQRIIANAIRDLEKNNGRVVLLHDAGGDRSATVAALGPLIDTLRARGYELTTIAGLLDAAPTAGNPSVPRNEVPQRVLTIATLQVANVVEYTLVTAFLVALVLGLVRLALIGGLATAQRFRPRYARRLADEVFTPTVSVVIPAYNEERVIARTILSVLGQDYPALQVIVVDDGSTDGTLAAAQAVRDPRVVVLHQPNGGKATALNHGIVDATGDMVVVIDADTVLAPDAIRQLVRPLADKRVGAVAGNAKVGNRVNLVTRWQAVEYVTSQNLDRRAFVMLNCITVVPGAIGAWRRSAILEVGGFKHETMAEDQDLTLTLLRAGHRIALADRAIAYTEAPETLDALLRQRFRWSFGTLQCAWKHRAAFLRKRAGSLGLVGLPNIWLFQLIFPLLAPAADVALVWSMVRLGMEFAPLGWTTAWSHALPVVSLYAFFLLIDFITALIGVGYEKGESMWQALLVPLQRIAYRQVLYIALMKAMRAAARGWIPSWGKLERTGSLTAKGL